MNENRRIRESEREFDLKDMLCDVLLHYRSIIVGALCGLLIMGSYGVYKNCLLVNASSSELMQAVDTESIENKEMLDIVANQIIANKKLVESQQDYLDNSVLMRDDMDNVHCIDIKYGISVDISKKEKLNILVASYLLELSSDELYSDVSNALNGEVNKEYVYEIISTQVDGLEEDDSTSNVHKIVNVNSELDSLEVSNEASDNGKIKMATITISLVGPSDEFVQSVKECVNTHLYKYSDVIENDVCEHEFGEYYSNIYSNNTYEYFNKKASILGEMNQNASQKIALLKEMSDNQKIYVNSVVDSATEDKQLSNSIEGNENNKVKVDLIKCISIKWLFLGLFGGIVFVACCWALRYVFSANIHTVDDIVNIFEMIPYLLKRNYVNNKMDKLIISWRYSKLYFWNEDEIKRIVEHICLKSRFSDIVLIDMHDGVEKFSLFDVDRICNNMKVVSNVFSNIEAINSLDDVEAVIIVVGMSSTYKDCVNFKHFLERNGITIEGIVLA